jgi:hypothetical protein
MKRTTRPMVIVMIVHVILQTISLTNGNIFSIDQYNKFIRGDEYWLYVFFCAVSFIYILFVFVLIGIRAKLRNLITIILIASIMIIGQTANIINGNINSGYMSICVTAVLLYIFIQNMFRHIMMETINIEKDISSHDALTKVLSRISYNNKVKEFDKKIKPENDMMIYPLTSDINGFYCDLRCFHYQTVLKYLLGLSNRMEEIKKNKNNLKSLSEVGDTAIELQKLVHINSYKQDNMEMIHEIFKIVDEDYQIKENSILQGISQSNSETFYDDCITDKKDLDKILSLMILESLTQNGIENYAKIKRDILAVYGYQNIFLLRNLETLEWLKEKDKLSLKKIFKSNYQQISEKLNLFTEDFFLGKTDSLSYVHQGYCPISLRLIEKVGEGGWSEIKDTLQLIPGETSFPNNESEIANPKEELNTIFLVFLGGITYTEIEGIRYLNRKYKQFYDKSDRENKTRKQFIIITTQILNRKKLLNSLGKDFGTVYTIKKFYDDINKQEKNEKK